MNEPLPFLTARELSIGYQGRNQPKQIIAESLAVDLLPGQLVCLLGPNGAGKSTLMRTLAGLQPKLSGTISINGQSLHSFSAAALAQKLSLVLAERVDAENLLVRELVALGRTPYTGWLGTLTEQDNEKIQAALEATDTLIYQDRRLSQLSDGERQKVMLARALAQDTDLILLDEPTAHLDLPNRVEMMRLLHRLTRQTSKAILLSTHELDLALQAADRLWLLDPAGHLVTGTPEDLVLTGAFESTFAKGGFYFDKSTGTFTIHREETGATINLSGDDGLVFWTRRALQREGFSMRPNNEAACLLHVSTQEGITRWTSQVNGIQTDYLSIEALLNSLKSLKVNPLQY